MITTTKRDFLLNELPKILENLSPETKRNFGLMSPQHMVEHLTFVIKITAKKYEGVREMPPSKKQLWFQEFIKRGAPIAHRPSDKTEADLPPLKYASLEEAISNISKGVQRFYDFWDANQDHTPYTSFIGEISFEGLEQFHFTHFRFHLWQFGLIEEYP